MQRRLRRSKFFAAFLSVAVLLTTFTSTSYAGMIGTQTLVQTQHHDGSHARVSAFIAQERVAARLVELGADPAEVQARVSALTADELHQIESRIDELPAGGILAAIGLVFVILMILEFTGVIDIFKKA